jgi:quercetin dioxygenase-like cupin family protein
VLLKIAQGLGRRPSEFLDEQNSHCEAAHNAEARRRKHTDGNGATIERLSADLVDQRFDVYRVEHVPGSSMGQVPIHFDGEQLILGLSGELTVSIDGQHHPVGPGDTLHWKVDLPVSWRNDGDEPARFLVVGTLPQDMRGVLRGRGPAARALDPAPALTRRRDA